MGLFKAHRLRDHTIDAAQRAHVDHASDPARVQAQMMDIFEGYLTRKKPEQCLAKAQALLGRHYTNRTEAEKTNLTASLFAVCARRDPAFAAALPLAVLCDLSRIFARDQMLDDFERLEDIAPQVLEKAYLAVFECQRIPEAWAFFLARHFDAETMQQHVAFLRDPAVMAARKSVKRALADTPEAAPLGLDCVGRTLGTAPEDATPSRVSDISEATERRVRALLDATWAPAISQAGLLALCRGVSDAELDLLTGYMQTQPYQKLLEACAHFSSKLPGVRRVALDFGLDEARRDHRVARGARAGRR